MRDSSPIDPAPSESMPGKLQLSVRAALLGVLTLSAVSAFVSAGQQRWLAQNYRPQPINQQRGHGYYGPAAPKYADSYDSEANNPEIFLQYKNEDDEIPLDLALAEKGKTLPEGKPINYVFIFVCGKKKFLYLFFQSDKFCTYNY